MIAEADKPQEHRQTFTIHRALQGNELVVGRTTVDAMSRLPAGTLAVLLGKKSDESPVEIAWQVIAVDETSLSYFVHLPSTRLPPAERLPHFIRYLEHANALIAQDAYAEFGRAPYDAVAAIGDKLPMAAIRGYLADPAVPGERKGFYGLALGLARGDDDRRDNIALLREQIDRSASDFRAGFDGVIGGYLLLAGEPGLEHIERRFLANRDAARGDVLHAITALRFYHEYGKGISAPRLARAMSHLLDRAEYTAGAIVDLARWEAWEFEPRIAALWDRKESDDRFIRRAIVGYLRVCPGDDARRHLAELRRRDPEGIAEAERGLTVFGASR